MPSGATGAESRPNIVWIFVEDMNAWMGCYGDNTVPTPNIDKLASRGIRFDRAYMPAGVCSATRSAIALGAMQTSLGVHNHRSSRKRVPGEVIHLPQGVKNGLRNFPRQRILCVSTAAEKNDFNFMWDIKKLYDMDGREDGLQRTALEKSKKRDSRFFAQFQLKGGKNTGRLSRCKTSRSKRFENKTERC